MWISYYFLLNSCTVVIVLLGLTLFCLVWFYYVWWNGQVFFFGTGDQTHDLMLTRQACKPLIKIPGLGNYFEDNKVYYGSHCWFPITLFWSPVTLSLFRFVLLCLMVWAAILKKRDIMVAIVDFLLSCFEVWYHFHYSVLTCFNILFCCFILFKIKK